MRNLVEYPVTADETVAALKWAGSQYTKHIHEYGVGGIEGIALITAERFIEQNKERFDTFSKASMQVVDERS